MSLFGKGYNEQAQAPTDMQKRTVDANIYEATIKAAFAGQSKGGASSVTVELLLSNGKTYKETVYVTNRNGENTYNSNGVIGYLPGFLLINDLAVFATGKDLFDLESTIEERIVKLYDSEVKKEVSKPVPMIMGLIDCKVLVAIDEIRENKTKADSSGKYVPTNESRTVNSLVKVFDLNSKHTAVELNEGKDATYHDSWLADHFGKVNDKFKPVEASGNASTVTAPTSSGMFGKK